MLRTRRSCDATNFYNKATGGPTNRVTHWVWALKFPMSKRGMKATQRGHQGLPEAAALGGWYKEHTIVATQSAKQMASACRRVHRAIGA